MHICLSKGSCSWYFKWALHNFKCQRLIIYRRACLWRFPAHGNKVNAEAPPASFPRPPTTSAPPSENFEIIRSKMMHFMHIWPNNRIFKITLSTPINISIPISPTITHIIPLQYLFPWFDLARPEMAPEVHLPTYIHLLATLLVAIEYIWISLILGIFSIISTMITFTLVFNQSWILGTSEGRIGKNEENAGVIKSPGITFTWINGTWYTSTVAY